MKAGHLLAASFAALSITSPLAVAHAAEPIKIGVIMATSGPDVPQGTEMLNGMRMVLDQYGGKIGDRPVELIVEDDASNPNLGLQKARKLVNGDNVDMLAGILLSATALASEPVAIASKVPMITSLSAADAITGEKCSPWVFRVSYSNQQLSVPLAQWAAKKGYKKVYTLGSDFLTPKELAAGFKKTFEGLGGKVVGEAFSPFGKTQDFGPYLSQARAAEPDAILGLYFGAEAVLFTKQYDSFGLKQKLPLVATLGTTAVMLRQAQGESAAGVTSALNYLPELDTPENVTFQKAYRERTGKDASEFAVMGADTMRFALEGLKQVKGDTADRAALARAIAQVSYVGPRGPMKIDPKTNNIAQNIYIAETVKDGDAVKFRLVDTVPGVMADPAACKMGAL